MPPEIHDFLPLKPVELHILLALFENEQHGYRIMKDIEDRSNGKIRMGPGTLYEALRRMQERDLVATAAPPAEASGDARRRYFQLTALGRRVLEAEATRLADLIAVVRP